MLWDTENHGLLVPLSAPFRLSPNFVTLNGGGCGKPSDKMKDSSWQPRTLKTKMVDVNTYLVLDFDAPTPKRHAAILIMPGFTGFSKTDFAIISV